MIVSLDMLYALKHIYKAKVVVFCKNNTKNILKNLAFIDNIEVIQDLNDDTIKNINKYNFNYLITFHAKTFLIDFLLKTNAKCIITKNKAISILSKRCKVVFTSITKRFHKDKTDRNRMLLYARKINPKIFDKEIKRINFDVAIKTTPYNKNTINTYLQKNKIKNFIIINPFSISTNFNLNINSYLQLIQAILNDKNINIVIPTYNETHDDFIKSIKEFDTNLLNKIFIFKNNDDILNLAELISQSKCIISPSTGAIHIATNLKIPSIALYPPKDEIFWPTYNKDYIIITKTQNDLRENEKQELIENITKRLKKYL